MGHLLRHRQPKGLATDKQPLNGGFRRRARPLARPEVGLAASAAHATMVKDLTVTGIPAQRARSCAERVHILLILAIRDIWAAQPTATYPTAFVKGREHPGDPQMPGTIEEIQNSWIAGHLYYHQSLDQVVRSFVHPLVASLVREDEIGAFFFVRYALGGPHIRLRLRIRPGSRKRIQEAMQQCAQRFLQLTPSTRSVDKETIRRTNESLLRGEPNETDDSVYPDNWFRFAPFRPEVERYGGPVLFRASLDFFTLSSAAALQFLAKCAEVSRSVQLAHALQLLFRQALGFSVDELELIDLIRYGVDSWGGALPRVVEKGDAVACSKMTTFLQLLGDSLAEARALRVEGSCGMEGDLLALGAGRLSNAIRDSDRSTRARIGGSQLHMTATRLGLCNAEEVYISRLLSVTFCELRAKPGESLSWLRKHNMWGAVEQPGTAFGDLLSKALAKLAAPPGRPGSRLP